MAHYYDTTVTIGDKSYRVAVPVDDRAKTYGELLQAVMDANRGWSNAGWTIRAEITDNGFIRRRPSGCMSYVDFRGAII